MRKVRTEGAHVHTYTCKPTTLFVLFTQNHTGIDIIAAVSAAVNQTCREPVEESSRHHDGQTGGAGATLHPCQTRSATWVGSNDSSQDPLSLTWLCECKCFGADLKPSVAQFPQGLQHGDLLGNGKALGCQASAGVSFTTDLSNIGSGRPQWNRGYAEPAEFS